MPKFLRCSYWLALFACLLLAPAPASAQFDPYRSMNGIDASGMYGSCMPCQQAAGETDLFTPAYGTADVGFEASCGCKDNSLMTMGSDGDSSFLMPYQQQFNSQPYDYGSCSIAPDACHYPAPTGFPYTGDQYNTCSPGGYGNGVCGNQTICPCGNAAPIWFGAEALIWNTSASSLPALVTTSDAGTQQFDAGVPGRPATRTLYGGNSLFNGMHGGYRLRGGMNFDQCGISGMDAEFFMIGTRLESYHADSTGDPILARPFLNAASGLDDALLVAFPDLASGTIDIATRSRFNSGAMHYREVFWKECNPGYACPDNCWKSGPSSFSLGFQIGPRFMNLRESFGVNERLTSIDTGNQFQIHDSFRTKNQFWGGELGLFGTRQRCRWSLDGGVRLAIGGTNQQLAVSGQTTVVSDVTTTSPGGFLAQRTNSGSWERNRFTLLPQFDVGIGYQMTSTWRASVGYSLLYWGNVLRATDQIDPVVNPGLFPPEQNPLTGDLRPATLLHESGYLAHGITIGLEKRW